MKYIIYFLFSAAIISFLIYETRDVCELFSNNYNLPQKSLNNRCLVKYKGTWIDSNHYIKYAREPWRN